MLKIISSYLAHGEGKECVKCCGNTFLKHRKETLVLRQIEVRIKFKKGKIVRRVRNRQVGEYLEAFTAPAENKRKV